MKKKPPEPNAECELCRGKGWFRTKSGWPAECHRCFPEVLQKKRGEPVLPMPVPWRLKP